ncbi:MAG: dienelactone hydrolase family protein [Candidatus Acidiferrales bacterium]
MGATCLYAATYSLVGLGTAGARLEIPQSGSTVDLEAQMVQYPSGSLNIRAYLVKPRSVGKHPAIIVVHSTHGLDDRTEDVTRRFAMDGFVVLAPDLLSRAASSATPGPATVAQLPAAQTVDDLKTGYDFLAKDPDVDVSQISVVGFGWGGWRALMVAEDIPMLFRAVIYYGVTPSTGLENIHAPVLAHYAQYDYRNTGNAISTEKAMKNLGKRFTYYVYPEANADFVNSPDRHNAEATDLSWQRTIAFLRSPS